MKNRFVTKFHHEINKKIKNIPLLKVLSCVIFDGLDFLDFYSIKRFWVGECGYINMKCEIYMKYKFVTLIVEGGSWP